MSRVVTVREHDSLAESGLGDEDLAELRHLARNVLKRVDGDMAAELRGNGDDSPRVRARDTSQDRPGRARRHSVGAHQARLLDMLRTWRRLPAQLPYSDIRSMSRFPMLDVFVRQFLRMLAPIARNGLARRYVNVEENLRYLRGRIVFGPHLRENASNRTRFYTSRDELSVNRPANRLIHTALNRLASRVRNDANRQLLREALAAFDGVPLSADANADWRAHHIDRSMNHYRQVMQWVGLFLLQPGTRDVRRAQPKRVAALPHGTSVRRLPGGRLPASPATICGGLARTPLGDGENRW